MERSSYIAVIVIAVICLVPASVIVYNLFLSPGCGSGSTIPMERYSVNEWGLFKQVYNTSNSTYMMGPRPGTVPLPDVVEEVDCKPVIYFHGDGEMDLSVHVAFSAVEVKTIPEAIRTGGNITWNVGIAGDINDENDDAKVITESDKAFEYLFYEGRGHNYQNVMTTIIDFSTLWPRDMLDIKVQNIGTYAMEDIYIIYDRYDEKRILHYPMLAPGELINDTLGWSRWTNISELRGMLNDDLLERNLTDGEAEDLLDYWVDGDVDANGMRVEETLLQYDGMSAKILYFLPEEEYDKKLPIEFSKDPIDINRVGICYVTGIPVLRVR
jgi:hypothetical protein